MWRAVAVVLLTLAALWAVNQARDLVTMLVISVFFALALVPGVEHLHKKRGWRRGAAVAVIYLVGVVAVVRDRRAPDPAISTVGDEIAKSGSGWMTSLDDWLASTFGVHIVDKPAYKDGVVTVGEVLQKWSDKLLPAAGTALSKGASLVFEPLHHRHVHLLPRRRLPPAAAGVPLLVPAARAAAPGLDHRPVDHGTSAATSTRACC